MGGGGGSSLFYVSTWDIVTPKGQRNKKKGNVFQGVRNVTEIEHRLQTFGEHLTFAWVGDSRVGMTLCGNVSAVCVVSLVRANCVFAMSHVLNATSHVLITRLNRAPCLPLLIKEGHVLHIGTRMSIYKRYLMPPYMSTEKNILVVDARHTQYRGYGETHQVVTSVNDMIVFGSTQNIVTLLEMWYFSFPEWQANPTKVYHSEAELASYTILRGLDVRMMNFALSSVMGTPAVTYVKPFAGGLCNPWSPVYMNMPAPLYTHHLKNMKHHLVKRSKSTKNLPLCVNNLCPCCFTLKKCRLKVYFNGSVSAAAIAQVALE